LLPSGGRPRSSGDRARASGARCAGSNPAGGTAGGTTAGGTRQSLFEPTAENKLGHFGLMAHVFGQVASEQRQRLSKGRADNLGLPHKAGAHPSCSYRAGDLLATSPRAPRSRIGPHRSPAMSTRLLRCRLPKAIACLGKSRPRSVSHGRFTPPPAISQGGAHTAPNGVRTPSRSPRTPSRPSRTPSASPCSWDRFRPPSSARYPTLEPTSKAAAQPPYLCRALGRPHRRGVCQDLVHPAPCRRGGRSESGQPRAHVPRSPDQGALARDDRTAGPGGGTEGVTALSPNRAPPSARPPPARIHSGGRDGE
jgi:hypothetical protein